MAEAMSSLLGREMTSTADNVQVAVRQSRPASRSSEVMYAEVSRLAAVTRLAIPSPELCEQLWHAVELAAARDAESMQALRAKVCELTVVLRDRGGSPEKVLITLKALISPGSLPLIAPHPSDWNGSKMRQKVSAWCIEEFFSKSNGPILPSPHSIEK
jgi:hypothetical protein